jgi:hypothetical protein
MAAVIEDVPSFVARSGSEHDSDSDRSEAPTHEDSSKTQLVALQQRMSRCEEELGFRERQAAEKDRQLLVLSEKLKLAEQAARSAQAKACNARIARAAELGGAKASKARLRTHDCSLGAPAGRESYCADSDKDVRRARPQASFVQEVFGVQVWIGDAYDEACATAASTAQHRSQAWPEVPPAEAAFHGERAHYDVEPDVSSYRIPRVIVTCDRHGRAVERIRE